MTQSFEILYSSGDVPEPELEIALSGMLTTFDSIKEVDSRLPRPIINRDLIGVAVALKPNTKLADQEQVLTVAQIGEIDKPLPFETFVLKAMSRAFQQQNRGLLTDVAPAERLERFSTDTLYEISSASVDGLHVGFAGGWAQHGRLLAISFADSLAKALALPHTPDASTMITDDNEISNRIEWINEGQGSGDNTPEHSSDREKFRFIFKMLI